MLAHMNSKTHLCQMLLAMGFLFTRQILLPAVSHQTTHGKNPRNFTIDPSGTFLLVANQDSNNIITFRINQDTGHLEFAQQKTEVPKPVCLRIIN